MIAPELPHAGNWRDLVERDAKRCTALDGGPECCLFAQPIDDDTSEQPFNEITENNHIGGDSE